MLQKKKTNKKQKQLKNLNSKRLQKYIFFVFFFFFNSDIFESMCDIMSQKNRKKGDNNKGKSDENTNATLFLCRLLLLFNVFLLLSL